MIAKEILIEIGNTLNIDSNYRTVLSKLDEINRQTNQFWHSETKNLEDKKLISLFKGIVIVEKELNWIGGSVAGGIWIYKEIIKRNLDDNYSLANWTLSITNNPYLPFGSTNYESKSILEYFEKKTNIYHRKEIEKVNKEINFLNDKIIGSKNTIIRQQKEIEELKFRNSLLKKTNYEIAKIIISDKSKPIYFYLSELERLLEDDTLHKEIFIDIMRRFKDKERGNIKETKNKIEQKIKNYS